MGGQALASKRGMDKGRRAKRPFSYKVSDSRCRATIGFEWTSETLGA